MRNPNRIWGSKYVAKCSSHLSDPDQNQELLGCVGTKWRWDKDKFGIINFSSALSGSVTSFDIWSNIANEAIIVFGLLIYDEYNTHWQQSI